MEDNLQEKLMEIGLALPDLLMPKKDIDYEKWTVIACDQYTSQPEYWEKVEALVGESPSSLRLMLPEIYLEKEDTEQKLKQVQLTMQDYLKKDIFDILPQTAVLVERTFSSGKIRQGLVMAVDLEKYDYSAQSASLIRPSEGTIVSRLPPRIKIREKAPLELPHIMLLLDDPEKTVLEPLFNQDSKETLYDFPLLLGAGHLKGWKLQEPDKLKDSLQFLLKKAALKSNNPLLYAVGDGNHSLATAKAVWENAKQNLDLESRKNHPARFALVEIVNLYGPSLEFEPIYRLLKHCDRKSLLDFLKEKAQCRISESSREKVHQAVFKSTDSKQRIGFVDSHGYCLLEFEKEMHSLALGTLQYWLDEFCRIHSHVDLDYIHGLEDLVELSQAVNTLGLIVPCIQKEDFFQTIEADGVFPRKTFSMGEAEEKRFYLEARLIQEKSNA